MEKSTESKSIGKNFKRNSAKIKILYQLNIDIRMMKNFSKKAYESVTLKSSNIYSATKERPV